MANNIATFQKYISLLDEVYREASLTSVLDIDSSLVHEGANAGELILPRLSMDGLANYSRSGGYVNGDVTLTNETLSLNYDRGRRFTVDAMDDLETAGTAFGRLSAEFVRVKAAPEQDAFRFATYASASGITKVTAKLSDASAVLAALIESQNTMDSAEVPGTERFLFITPVLYNLVQNMDTTKSKAVLDSFDGVYKVPQSRFYTAIDLRDGVTSTAGGYAKASTGSNINFMVIHKPAVVQFNKHTVNRVIAPEDNQTSDGWLFFYRSYGLASVCAEKAAGVYLHAAA